MSDDFTVEFPTDEQKEALERKGWLLSQASTHEYQLWKKFTPHEETTYIQIRPFEQYHHVDGPTRVVLEGLRILGLTEEKKPELSPEEYKRLVEKMKRMEE